VTNREQGDIAGHIPQSIQKENHPDQEQQVVVAGDHVLGAQINKWDQVHAARALQERLVSGRDAMSQHHAAEQQQ
jgi:hypothetical protein